MGLYYSASERGFFDDAFHAVLPEDAVTITPAQHRRLLERQSQGCSIEADSDGRPRAVAPARPGIAELRQRKIRAVKAEAGRRIEAVAPVWKQLNALRSDDGGAALFAAIEAIRAAADALEASIARMKAADLAAFDPTSDEFWPASA